MPQSRCSSTCKNTPKTVSLNYQIPISNSHHIMKCKKFSFVLNSKYLAILLVYVTNCFNNVTSCFAHQCLQTKGNLLNPHHLLPDLACLPLWILHSQSSLGLSSHFFSSDPQNLVVLPHRCPCQPIFLWREETVELLNWKMELFNIKQLWHSHEVDMMFHGANKTHIDRGRIPRLIFVFCAP